MNIIFNNAKLYLYGLYSYPHTVIGCFVILLYMYKGIISILILMKKEIAIKLAIFDGIVGIIIYSVVLVFTLFNIQLSDGRFFGIDILFLVPYLMFFLKQKKLNSNLTPSQV